jgi:hypothetical protein
VATESLVFDILAKDGASPSFAKVGTAAQEAAGRLKDLSSRLKDVSGKVATARTELKGDKEALHQIDTLEAKLAGWAHRVGTGNLRLDGVARARADISGVELALDRLDHKHVTATVEVNTRGGLLGRLQGLFGAGAGAAGSAAGGIASGVGGGGGDITSLVKLIGLGGAGAIGAALLPALAPTAVGGGVGILGAVLGDPKALKRTLAALTSTVKAALAPLKPVFDDLFTGLDKFIKAQGPALHDLFKASLPFLQAFATIMEQAAKTILPAVTRSLKEMAPSLPLIVQGFGAVTQGFADMIKAIGPRGMEASAKLFVDLCRVMGLALTVFGKAINFLAVTVQTTVHAIHQEWDDLRHLTAGAFDQIRHYVAASWDATWRDTVGKAQSGIATIIGYFRALPGRIINAVTGLGHTLGAFASAAMNEMWNGFKSVGGKLLSWLAGFASSIINVVKKILGIASPSSVFHAIGVNLMEGLTRGIESAAKKAANAARKAAGGVAGAHGGPATGGPGQAQAYARSRLSAYGWGPSQMGPLILLWNQESGWNRFARNPSSGAYGIPQALPPGKMGPAANPPTSSMAAQVNWGLGYIRSRYGSPANAWAHERAFNWYGRGGIIPEPVIGLGLRTGRGYGFGENGPELVTPAGRAGAGMTIVIQIDPVIAASTPDRKLGQSIAQHLLMHTKGGGRLYPTGVIPK